MKVDEIAGFGRRDAAWAVIYGIGEGSGGIAETGDGRIFFAAGAFFRIGCAPGMAAATLTDIGYLNDCSFELP